jgi:hypothetical protein
MYNKFFNNGIHVRLEGQIRLLLYNPAVANGNMLVV